MDLEQGLNELHELAEQLFPLLVKEGEGEPTTTLIDTTKNNGFENDPINFM